jgi:rSAM/selenodomain-associated transferase 1
MVWEHSVKTCVVVFGREPIPGQVKSRLGAAIGPEVAARIYAAMLEHALEVARNSGARVVLSLADVPSGSWVERLDVAVEIQKGSNLGDRMHDAFTRRFAEGERHVVMVGSDCPGFSATHIAKASAKLGGAEVVLGPATDGGYWLVAQRPPGIAMFAGIPWSSPDTLERTRKRIAGLGNRWLELEELVDVDTIDDLEFVLTDPRTPETLRRRLLSALER